VHNSATKLRPLRPTNRFHYKAGRVAHCQSSLVDTEVGYTETARTVIHRWQHTFPYYSSAWE